MQLFRTKGQKFLHCPGTKGQRDNLKILPRDETGLDSLSKCGTGHGTWDGTVQYFDILSRLVQQDKLEQSRKGRFKTEKDVLKQVDDILKQEIWSFFLNFF